MASLRRKLYRPHLGARRSDPSRVTSHRDTTVASSRIARYVSDGVPARAPDGATIQDALDFALSTPDSMSMLLYAGPTPAIIDELTAAWDLHPLLIEDLVKGSQRPKIERHRDVLFIVARSAWYVDKYERVEFAEFHILLRPDSVVVLCQDGRWIDGTDVSDLDSEADVARLGLAGNLMSNNDMLRLGPESVAYKLLDDIVDGFIPVLEGLDIDKDQIERQVFSGDAAATERIYRLSQEVIDLKQACASLNGVVTALATGSEKSGMSVELQTYFTDLTDHLMRVNSEVIELYDSLTQILSVNATLVGQRQNEDMKKISGWAAILFAPSLIAAIYGMNFVNMPGLKSDFGYPVALVSMLLFSFVLYRIFKRKKWM